MTIFKCSTCNVKKEFNLSNFRADRKQCRECENARKHKIKAEAVQNPGKQPLKKTIKRSKTYVVTYAQNATPVHIPFLKALEVYCQENDAQLVVIPGRYTNPTSIWSKSMQHQEWWDKSVHPYLFEGRKTLGSHLEIFGDISIQPTDTRPLTGFEVFSGEHSAIFGHPKLELKTIATAKRHYPRILTTTGAVTRPNYTKSKAGKKSEARHTLGAVVVEQGEKLFHIRHITAKDDGSFIDLEHEYAEDGYMEADRPLALVCGDIHVDQSDPAVLNATFTAQDSIVKKLKPEHIVYHDVLDFNRRNHHTINSFTDRYARLRRRTDGVEAEVQGASIFLENMTPQETQAIVVQSNHDEAFDRWLNEADPKRDPENADFYHRMWVMKLAAFKEEGHWTPAFQLFHKQFYKDDARAKFLDRETPLRIGGVFVNFHGDHGLNGARGSTQTYAQLGAKTIIGHSHSPAILDGCFQVGVTARLNQGYNKLPSGWLNTHCLIYANGERTLLNVIDGAWRG